MLHDLYPTYIQIAYQSAFGNHVATRTASEWTGTGLGDPGTFTAWNASTIAGDVMVEALIDAMASEFLPSTTIQNYTIFRVPAPGEAGQPVYTKAYPTSGTLVDTGQAKAVQYTVSFRTFAFGIVHFPFLDSPASNIFGNIPTASARDTDVIAELTSPANAWSGRDGAQIGTFLDVSVSLNKRLRRKYNMI